MEPAAKVQPTTFKTWVQAIGIWVFLCLWISAMTGALTGMACRKDRYEAAKKLRYCNISYTVGFWVRALPDRKVQRAAGRIQLERGIALLQLGRDEKAREAFETALRQARLGAEKAGPSLHQRMVALKDDKALTLWATVILAANQGHWAGFPSSSGGNR